MSKMKSLIRVLIVCLLMFTLVACSDSRQAPRLKGFYQSEWVAGEIIQISIYDDENRFVEYITNREVNSGTYTSGEDGSYQFDGNEHDFDIFLSNDNSFEIMLPKLDETHSILMKNISNVPASFSTEWDDVEKYKDLLK